MNLTSFQSKKPTGIYYKLNLNLQRNILVNVLNLYFMPRDKIKRNTLVFFHT